MAITISGENNNDKILAQDGVIDQISGINIVGLITASHINVGSNIQLGNAGIITATTFVGNVTGNVNSTSPLLLQTGGSERFRITGNNELGIAGANYGSAGQVLTSGGSGSAVTWSAIPTQVTINNNAANRIITGEGGTTLNGESTLTYNGNGTLNVLGASGNTQLALHRTNANTTGTTGTIGFYASDGHTVAGLYALGDGDNEGAHLVFKTTTAASGTNPYSDLDERLRITSAGKIGIGTDDPKQNVSITNGRVNIDSRGDYYGVWIDGDTNATSAVNIGRWHNTGGRIKNGGSSYNDLIIETMNTSHNLQLQPTGGNVLVGTTDSTIYNQNSGEGIVLRGGQALDIARSGDLQLTLNRMSNEGANIALYQAGGFKATIGTKSGAIYFGTSGDTERLRIDSSGRVLMGTTSLHNSNTYSNNLIIYENGDTGASIIGNNSNSNYASLYLSDTSTASRSFLEAQLGANGNFTIGTNGTGPIRFNNGSGEQARIKDGIVFVGTQNKINTSPTKFQVASNDATGSAIFARFNANSYSSYLDFYKSRSNTLGTAYVVNSNDHLGALRFYGADGSNSGYTTAAEIYGSCDGGSGASGDMPGRITFHTRPDGAGQSMQERLRITSAGFLGMGYTLPQTKLNVKGTISTGRNVARELGTVINVSSQYSSGRSGSNVINGNKNNEAGGDWLTASNSRTNANLTIDLGTAISCDRFVIYNQNEYDHSNREVRGFTLEGSNDNSNWTTLLDDECGCSHAHEPNPGFSFRLPEGNIYGNDDSEGVSYRYWRFTMKTFHGSDSAGHGGVMELELYEQSQTIHETSEICTHSLVAGDISTQRMNGIQMLTSTEALNIHTGEDASDTWEITPRGLITNGSYQDKSTIRHKGGVMAVSSSYNSGDLFIRVDNLYNLDGNNWWVFGMLILSNEIQGGQGGGHHYVTSLQLMGLSQWSSVSKQDIVGNMTVSMSNYGSNFAELFVNVNDSSRGPCTVICNGGTFDPPRLSFH